MNYHKKTKLTALETVRSLIDDIDGVAFGNLSKLFDEMGEYCAKALREQEELQLEIENLRHELSKVRYLRESA